MGPVLVRGGASFGKGVGKGVGPALVRGWGQLWKGGGASFEEDSRWGWLKLGGAVSVKHMHVP